MIVKIKVPDNGEYAILNPISGSFDIINEREHEMLRQPGEGGIPGGEFASYSCNLACTYCFKHDIQRWTDLSPQGASLCIDNRPSLITKEAVDAFFDYAGNNFSKGPAKPFITLFGGEPLINSPSQRSIIEYIVNKCIQEDYELAAVTNGYDLAEYIDILKKEKINEIQVPLDGSREIHDGRRATANKKGTFDRIISGMQAAIKEGMPINLRSVVDLENIGDIVNLAEFLDSKGWA
ncbi:MAG: radical SAM protein [Clostridia bacterium]